MAAPIRTLHYINQFFAGIGGEEANDLPVEVREPSALDEHSTRYWEIEGR